MKGAARQRKLEEFRDISATLAIYEAPHRILDLLADIEQVCGGAPVVAARELTKLHEEFLRGTAVEIAATLQKRDPIRGEFTVLIGPRPPRPSVTTSTQDVQMLMREGMPEMEAIKTVAKRRNLGKREVYAEFVKEKR